MRVWLLIALLLVSTAAGAKDFGEVREAYFDFKDFGILNTDQRNSVIYPTPPQTALNFGINTDLFWGCGYLDAEVESLTDESQFREVGLGYRFGVRPSKYVEFGLWHLSQHNLDRASPSGYYPFETGLELKIWLIRK